jgi:hypothetical protein
MAGCATPGRDETSCCIGVRTSDSMGARGAGVTCSVALTPKLMLPAEAGKSKDWWIACGGVRMMVVGAGVCVKDPTTGVVGVAQPEACSCSISACWIDERTDCLTSSLVVGGNGSIGDVSADVGSMAERWLVVGAEITDVGERIAGGVEVGRLNDWGFAGDDSCG